RLRSHPIWPDQVLTEFCPRPNYRSTIGRRLMASPCLLALIATLLLLTSVAAFREPDYSLAVDTAECQYLKPDSWEATGVKQLYIPFTDKPESGEPARTVRCSFDLDLSEDETQDVALLIPSFSDSVTISV